MNEEVSMSGNNQEGAVEALDIERPKKNWIEAMCEREATPKAAREGTIESFCKEWGISESTYGYQKRLKENKKRIVEIWLNEASNGGNEVLAKLKENALLGKEKSIEMYLKFVLELAENLDIKSDGKAIVINKILYGANDTSQIYPKGLPDTISESNTKPTVQ